MAAAIAPDVDGLGIVPELLTRNTTHPLLWFSQYHHSLHTLAFALVVTFVAFLISANTERTRGQGIQDQHRSARPWMTVSLVFLSFHLHLLCDLAGARGPDGDQWPIPYLLPFSNSLQLTWSGQWALNAWPNFVITGVLLVATLWIAWKYGSSPVELASKQWNQKLIEVVRTRFR